VTEINEEDFQMSRQKIEDALSICDSEKAQLLEDLLEFFSDDV